MSFRLSVTILTAAAVAVAAIAAGAVMYLMVQQQIQTAFDDTLQTTARTATQGGPRPDDRFGGRGGGGAVYLSGRADIFAQIVDTSGTIVGVSRALRPKHVRIVAVQPSDALHGIEGWKHMPTALRPAIWDERVADVHLVMATEEALAMTKRLAREEGIFTGPSGGAAVAAAIAVAREEAGRIVVLIADGGERYLSTPLWE